MHCRTTLAQFEQHHEIFTSAGIQLIAIAQGEPKHADRYCTSLAPSLTCLTRDDTAAYTAYGLEKGGLSSLFKPEMLAESFKAMMKGNFNGKPTGDIAMLPGVFVIDTVGDVRWAYRGEHVADTPAPEAVLTAAQTALAAGA
jgi:peroxiredoxin